MSIVQREAFKKEITDGIQFFEENRFEQAFKKFERAHILGQLFIIPHTQSHYWMLRIGIRIRDFREVRGQIFRILLGIIGSGVGVVPLGNSGRSNVSAFARMPIPDDLKKLMD